MSRSLAELEWRDPEGRTTVSVPVYPASPVLRSIFNVGSGPALSLEIGALNAGIGTSAEEAATLRVQCIKLGDLKPDHGRDIWCLATNGSARIEARHGAFPARADALVVYERGEDEV